MGKAPAGNYNVAQLAAPDSLRERPEAWHALVTRVRNGEMPPKGAPSPALDQREAIVGWAQDSLRSQACAAGISPGLAPTRRLSRAQYSSTLRDLLNLHIDVGGALPADGAGGEGLDTAAETLFLSQIHAEKYLDAAKLALVSASKDPRSRAKFLIAKPEAGVTPTAAARSILAEFLPRAFRRPLDPGDLSDCATATHRSHRGLAHPQR